jgi:thiamine-monophosphate kinase
MAGGEFAAVERIRLLLAQCPPEGETWIGDDAAVLEPPVPGQALLLSTDTVVVGVHADLGLLGLDDLGWKAMAAAVSDMAAMGGYPRHCLVSVMGPPDTDLEQLYRGLAAASERWTCPIVGGDLVNAPFLAVSVSVSGSVPLGRRAVLRSGARPGDLLFVTGPLGASASGLALLRAESRVPPTGDSTHQSQAQRLVLAHRRPAARIAEGSAAASGGATAMIDVSDGFAADLGHLADSSGIGFALVDVPVAEGADLADALGGGEDYELVFAAPEEAKVTAAFAQAALTKPVLMGTCTSDPSERRLWGEQLGRLGWEHEWR